MKEEIRRKKEKQTAGPLSGCDRFWPFAVAAGTFSGGSQRQALAKGKQALTQARLGCQDYTGCISLTERECVLVSRGCRFIYCTL